MIIVYRLLFEYLQCILYILSIRLYANATYDFVGLHSLYLCIFLVHKHVIVELLWACYYGRKVLQVSDKYSSICIYRCVSSYIQCTSYL